MQIKEQSPQQPRNAKTCSPVSPNRPMTFRFDPLFKTLNPPSMRLLLLLCLALASQASSPDLARTVIVMRHCVRTTPFTLDGEFFPDFNDYSSRPFPDWKFPAWQCTPRGLDMIASEGAFLQDNQVFALPLIKVVSDAIDRDVGTSLSLLQGLGMPSFPVFTDVWPAMHLF